MASDSFAQGAFVLPLFLRAEPEQLSGLVLALCGEQELDFLAGLFACPRDGEIIVAGDDARRGTAIEAKDVGNAPASLVLILVTCLLGCKKIGGRGERQAFPGGIVERVC